MEKALFGGPKVKVKGLGRNLRSSYKDFVKRKLLSEDVVSVLKGTHRKKATKPTPITLSVEQVEEYECAFKLFDTNGDGVITTDELGAMLNSIGLNPSQKEIHDMISEVDCDGDGTIDFCEFLKMMSRHSNPGVDPEQQLADVFRLFDRDSSGYITQDELRNVMLSLGQPISDSQLWEMISHADMDGDGKINIKEFVKIMTTEPK